jgi:hypothetical protein
MIVKQQTQISLCNTSNMTKKDNIPLSAIPRSTRGMTTQQHNNKKKGREGITRDEAARAETQDGITIIFIGIPVSESPRSTKGMTTQQHNNKKKGREGITRDASARAETQHTC